MNRRGKWLKPGPDDWQVKERRPNLPLTQLSSACSVIYVFPIGSHRTHQKGWAAKPTQASDNLSLSIDCFPDISVCPAVAAAKSCPSLCDPIDGSPPGSPVPGILQARTLEWVAISFSIVWKWKVKVKSLSRIQLLATPWTAAYQAPPSMGFSRQEYWSGVPLPSPLKQNKKK